MKSKITESEKKNIIEEYDRTCDQLPHTSILLDNGTSRTFGQKFKIGTALIQRIARGDALFSLHRTNEELILSHSIRYTSDRLSYIENPDFVVNEFLHNPTNKSELCIPTSIEQSIYIGKLMEQYFKLDPKKVARKIPDHLIGYLDRGLIALALRIRKVMIAPGIYQLVEEIVPIFLSAYNEMLKKLMSDFEAKTRRVPTKMEIEHLKSLAMSLVCDEQYASGRIVEKDTLKALNEGKLDSITSSKNSKFVNNWGKYHDQVFDEYGIEWEDDYYDHQDQKVNIWNDCGNVYFDNRPLEQGKIITLKKQSKKF